MRKICLAALLALLLLCGCGSQGEETEPTAISEPGQTPVTTRIEKSAVELETRGAVRTYDIPEEYDRLYSMGEHVLLASRSGELMALKGEDGVIYATASLGAAPEEVGLSVSPEGVGYYLKSENAFVLLNPQLHETDRFPMPQDMQGMPQICLERNEIFYCTENEIRAIHIQSGISRPIRKHTCQSQKILATYFGGKMLKCEITDLSGETGILYLSGEDGAEIAMDPEITRLDTDEKRYYVECVDGIIEETLIGERNGKSFRLLLDSGDNYPVWQQEGIVNFHHQNRVLHIGLYHAASGVRTSYGEIRDVLAPVSVAGGEHGVWFLAADQYQPVPRLYFWDSSASKVEETDAYIQAVAEGEEINETPEMKQCFDRAEEIFFQYGVRVAITDQAVRMAGEQVIVPEHQTRAYDIVMDRMEDVLSLYPKNFLTKKYDVRVGIVRSINGKQEPLYIRNAEIHSLIIPVGCDIESALFKFTGSVIDAYLLNEKMQYIQWDKQNPEGFDYGSDSVDPAYLSGENRAFLNEISMLSPANDRAELFAAAMAEGNKELFAYPMLQNKLRAVCEAIRAGFWLKDETVTYPWEQYLIPLPEKEE